jgi:membrane associated rhomboid family serine protease
MVSKETVNKVFFLSDQEYRRNIKRLTLFLIISGIVYLVILCGLFVLWKYYNLAEISGTFIVIFTVIFSIIFTELIKLRKSLIVDYRRQSETKITHICYYR